MDFKEIEVLLDKNLVLKLKSGPYCNQMVLKIFNADFFAFFGLQIPEQM